MWKRKLFVESMRDHAKNSASSMKGGRDEDKDSMVSVDKRCYIGITQL